VGGYLDDDNCEGGGASFWGGRTHTAGVQNIDKLALEVCLGCRVRIRVRGAGYLDDDDCEGGGASFWGGRTHTAGESGLTTQRVIRISVQTSRGFKYPKSNLK